MTTVSVKFKIYLDHNDKWCLPKIEQSFVIAALQKLKKKKKTKEIHLIPLSV